MPTKVETSSRVGAFNATSNRWSYIAALLAVVVVFGLIGLLQFQLSELRHSLAAWITFALTACLMVVMIWASHRLNSRRAISRPSDGT